MARGNGNASAISDGDLEEIRGALGILKEKLAPHLQSLNPEDRRELLKMGDKTVAFVQKAVEYGMHNKELAPPYLDMGSVEASMKVVMNYRELAQELRPIIDALYDTIMLFGSEAYQGALIFYANIKSASKARVPKARSIYEDLATRFPGAPTMKKKPED